MKKWMLLSIMLGAMSLSMMAQDDVYFVPTKANVAKQKAAYGVPQDTYYSGSSRSVDDYNRRGSAYEVLPTDTGDVISFSAVEGVYPDSLGDFALTRQMQRWDGYEPTQDYWAGYSQGRYDAYGWHSPWYYSYYPWYDYSWGWYDPWYYGSWYGGWYDPWYYRGWGWGGYYGYWHHPSWYYGWYGGGYYGGPAYRGYRATNYESTRGQFGRSGNRVGSTTRVGGYSTGRGSFGASRTGGSPSSTRSTVGNSSSGRSFGASRTGGSFGGSSSGGSSRSYSSGSSGSSSSGGGGSFGGSHSSGGGGGGSRGGGSFGGHR